MADRTAAVGRFQSDFDKNTRPILEKLAANGTLTGWGAYETIVHTKDGPTHGVWFMSNTAAGIEQARGELLKGTASSTSVTGATAHNDFYLESLGNGKPGSGTNGFLTVSSYAVKPGQGQAWRQAWEKTQKPIFDDLVAKGLLRWLLRSSETFHTETPALRFVATLSPNIDAEDKMTAAFEAAMSKRTPEEQKAATATAMEVAEPGAHRDQFARVLRYWSK